MKQRAFSLVKATENGAWAGFIAAWAVSSFLLLVEVALGVQTGLFYSVIGIALGASSGSIDSVLAGFLLHILAGTIIGAAGGFSIAAFPVLAIYRMKKSLIVGVSIGLAAWLVLFLPLTFLVVSPKLDSILVPLPGNTGLYTVASQSTGIITLVMVGSVVFHTLYGLVYGTMMAVLIPRHSRVFRCERCAQAFPSQSQLEDHLKMAEHML